MPELVEDAEPRARDDPVGVSERALIVRPSVRIAESSPPQYFADVTTFALPDGCTEFGRFEVRREGETDFVDVFNPRRSLVGGLSVARFRAHN